jgi:hypothetical protein
MMIRRKTGCWTRMFKGLGSRASNRWARVINDWQEWLGSLGPIYRRSGRVVGSHINANHPLNGLMSRFQGPSLWLHLVDAQAAIRVGKVEKVEESRSEGGNP